MPRKYIYIDSPLPLLFLLSRYSFVEEDAALLASMGHNTIRLGVLWAGMEPVEGQYNMTYMEQIKICVDTAEKYGLYPVLDMHQAGIKYLQIG